MIEEIFLPGDYMTDILLPCPFRGCTNLILDSFEEPACHGDDAETLFRVICESCCFEIVGITKEFVINSWNTRYFQEKEDVPKFVEGNVILKTEELQEYEINIPDIKLSVNRIRYKINGNQFMYRCILKTTFMGKMTIGHVQYLS